MVCHMPYVNIALERDANPRDLILVLGCTVLILAKVSIDFDVLS